MLPAESLVPPDRWFGRSAEAAALTAAVVGSSANTLAILGPPGIGKSTLGRHVVTSTPVIERFGKRRWRVELQSATDAAALRTAIIVAVSLDPALHKFPKALTLLGRCPALLVLDNLETPWERDMNAVQDCLRQLAAVPNLVLLVSLRGNVAPTGPAFAHQQVLGPLTDDAAQRLFLDLARHVSPRDPALRPLLRDLGGVPLAIELVATRAAPHSSLDDVWAEWQRRGIVLATHPDFQEGRLTSLVRSIDFSVQSPRLCALGRRLFWLLGQLPSGLARVDAAAFLGNDAMEAKGQLLVTGLAFSRRGGRMDLLPPLRQFALTVLQAPEGPDRTSWYRHYLDLVATLGPRVGEVGGSAAVTRLKPEIANVEAALAAVDMPTMRPAAVTAALGFAELIRFTGIGTAAPLLALAIACHAAQDFSGEAHCTRSLGDIMRDRSDYDLAELAYERALLLFRQLGNAYGMATCIQNISDIASFCGDYDKVWIASNEALQLFKEANNDVGAAVSLKSSRQGRIHSRR